MAEHENVYDCEYGLLISEKCDYDIRFCSDDRKQKKKHKKTNKNEDANIATGLEKKKNKRHKNDHNKQKKCENSITNESGTDSKEFEEDEISGKSESFNNLLDVENKNQGETKDDSTKSRIVTRSEEISDIAQLNMKAKNVSDLSINIDNNNKSDARITNSEKNDCFRIRNENGHYIVLDKYASNRHARTYIFKLENHPKYQYYVPTLKCMKHNVMSMIQTTYSFKCTNNHEMDSKVMRLVPNKTKFERIDNGIYFINNDLDKPFWRIQTTIKEYGTPITGYIDCNPDFSYQVFHKNRTIEILFQLVCLVVNYSMLVSLVFDFFLIIEIYLNDDFVFVFYSLFFICFTLLLFSILICIFSKRNETSPIFEQMWIVNIPYFFTFGHKNYPDGPRLVGLFSVTMTALMNYPLYIINVSYILENCDTYADISLVNILQLISSIITLAITPLLNYLSQVQQSYVKHSGLILTTCDSVNVYSYILLILGPMMTLEIIHFFPILFAYYLNDDNDSNFNSIEFQHLIIIIGIFNVPKLIFIIHIWNKYQKIRHEKYFFNCLADSIVLILLFLILPLMPYTIVMIERLKYCEYLQLFADYNITDITQCKFKTICFSIAATDKKQNVVFRYYRNIVIYLWLSFIGSSIVLYYLLNYNIFTISIISVTIWFTWLICIYLTIFLPLLWYKLLRYAPFGFQLFARKNELQLNHRSCIIPQSENNKILIK